MKVISSIALILTKSQDVLDDQGNILALLYFYLLAIIGGGWGRGIQENHVVCSLFTNFLKYTTCVFRAGDIVSVR